MSANIRCDPLTHVRRTVEEQTDGRASVASHRGAPSDATHAVQRSAPRACDLALPALGDPMPFEDVDGDSVAYAESDELEEH